MRIPNETLRQRAVVETYMGEGARGPTFAPPVADVPVSSQVMAKIRVDWKDEEFLVTHMVLARPEVGATFALGSRVTIGEEVLRVVKAFASPDDFRPTHFELMCASWGSEHG